MDLDLGDVEVTALIPLSNRASETLRKKPRVRDEKAVEIIKALGVDTKNYDKLITHECVIARTIMFDETVRHFIEKYPQAVCVNMGCGLDNRYDRVNSGNTKWFDVDLADSIAVRKKVYEETPNRKMIGASVIDTDWIDEVKIISGNEPVIVIAEGLFMYFSKEQTETILHNLVNHFSKGFLVVEMMRPSMMDEKKHETVKHTDAKFGWGTKSGKEFEELEPKMELFSEKSFAVQLRKSRPISKLIGIVSAKINNRIAVFQWQNSSLSGKQQRRASQSTVVHEMHHR